MFSASQNRHVECHVQGGRGMPDDGEPSAHVRLDDLAIALAVMALAAAWTWLVVFIASR